MMGFGRRLTQDMMSSRYSPTWLMVDRVEGLSVVAEFDHEASFHVLVSKKGVCSSEQKNKNLDFGSIHSPRTLVQMTRKLPVWETSTIYLKTCPHRLCNSPTIATTH